MLRRCRARAWTRRRWRISSRSASRRRGRRCRRRMRRCYWVRRLPTTSASTQASSRSRRCGRSPTVWRPPLTVLGRATRGGTATPSSRSRPSTSARPPVCVCAMSAATAASSSPADQRMAVDPRGRGGPARHWTNLTWPRSMQMSPSGSSGVAGTTTSMPAATRRSCRRPQSPI